MALEKTGIPSVTLVSRSFCPLGQFVARGLSYPGLPIVSLPHPIRERDPKSVARKGIEATAECVRLLTSPSEAIGREFMAKRFPLPEHTVARS